MTKGRNLMNCSTCKHMSKKVFTQPCDGCGFTHKKWEQAYRECTTCEKALPQTEDYFGYAYGYIFTSQCTACKKQLARDKYKNRTPEQVEATRMYRRNRKLDKLR